jgi:hypothetical protein
MYNTYLVFPVRESCVSGRLVAGRKNERDAVGVLHPDAPLHVRIVLGPVFVAETRRREGDWWVVVHRRVVDPLVR